MKNANRLKWKKLVLLKKAIKHSIEMDRSAREKGFKNQAEYLASIPEKGEKKQDATMWVLPKDTREQTYTQGWQVKKGFGEWEDVSDQKVADMPIPGVSTLSHVRYRQKDGSKKDDSTASTGSAMTSLFKAPKDDEEKTGSTSDLLSLFSSVCCRLLVYKLVAIKCR